MLLIQLHGDLSGRTPSPWVRQERKLCFLGPPCKQRLSRTPAATSAGSRWHSTQHHALVTPQEPQCIVESISAAALSLSHAHPTLPVIRLHAHASFRLSARLCSLRA